VATPLHQKTPGNCQPCPSAVPPTHRFQPKIIEGFRPRNPHDWLNGHHAMKKLFSARTLILAICLGLISADQATAQTITIMHGYYHYNDGSGPDALFLSGNSLYGVTREYGTSPPEYSDSGTVLRLSFAPRLTISRSEVSVVLTWPTNVAGFDYSGFILQSTTKLASPAIWSTNSSAPVVVNGQSTVTNPAFEPQRFFPPKSNSPHVASPMKVPPL
jgi:hypothetical protein